MTKWIKNRSRGVFFGPYARPYSQRHNNAQDGPVWPQVKAACCLGQQAVSVVRFHGQFGFLVVSRFFDLKLAKIRTECD
jgi:hypothetical protein